MPRGGSSYLVNRMFFLRVWHNPCDGDIITTAVQTIGPGSVVQSSGSSTRLLISGPSQSPPGWWPEGEHGLELRRTHRGTASCESGLHLPPSLSGERAFALSLPPVFSAYFLFLFDFTALILLL